jgi:ComF family protein
LRKAVGQLKYHRRRALARPLGDLLAGIGIPDADAIVPVPLFKKRLCTREYNQSALLAAHLSKSTGIPVLLNRLFKVRETPPQVGLSAAQRRKNLKGAFSVRQRGGIMGRRILLVDDVITTGATAAECATALLEAGATEVYIVALAHGIQA